MRPARSACAPRSPKPWPRSPTARGCCGARAGQRRADTCSPRGTRPSGRRGRGMDERAGEAVEIEAVETLAENWNPLRKYTLAYPRRDGTRQRLAREVYFNGPGVAVLPLDPRRGTVLLTRQFRLPVQLNGDGPRL